MCTQTYAACDACINLADAVIHSHLQLNNATAYK